MRSGQELAEYTASWIKNHRATFKQIMHIAHLAVEEGERISGPEIYYWAKDRNITITEVKEFRRDKTLWAGIARYMVMLRPVLSKCLEFRPSKMDDVDMAAIWHDNVNAGTFFLAASRKEAQHLCEIGDVSAT